MRFATDKQKLIVFIILFMFIPLFAQTETLPKKEFLKIKYEQTYISLSPFISPRICLGILNSAQRDDDRYQESIFYVHACETFLNYRLYGLSFRGNTFLSKNTRSGPIFIINVGIDYNEYEPLNFTFKKSGSSGSGRIKKRLFPNLAAGFGYSFRLKNDSYFRLECDFGLKIIGGNIHLTYIW